MGQYIFTMRTESADSRGFTYLCNWRCNSSPGKKELVCTRLSQGCNMNSSHMTYPLNLFEMQVTERHCWFYATTFQHAAH